MDSAWLTGDPGGMRALAGTLRSTATSVALLQAAGDGDVAAMTFDGPAGLRFTERMRGGSRAVDGAVMQLLDLASTLDGAAARVEAAQAEQRREEERAREEARRHDQKAGAL